MSQLKKGTISILQWIILIPVCAIAIYCFYKGAFYSIEWQAAKIDARIAQTGEDYNFGGMLILLGWALIVTVAMVLVNLLVHISAGIKTFRGKFSGFCLSLMTFRRSDCRQSRRIKILFYGLTVLYSGWFVYAIHQSNAYYAVWSVLAILVTMYYCSYILSPRSSRKYGTVDISGKL